MDASAPNGKRDGLALVAGLVLLGGVIVRVWNYIRRRVLVGDDDEMEAELRIRLLANAHESQRVLKDAHNSQLGLEFRMVRDGNVDSHWLQLDLSRKRVRITQRETPRDSESEDNAENRPFALRELSFDEDTALAVIDDDENSETDGNYEREVVLKTIPLHRVQRLETLRGRPRSVRLVFQDMNAADQSEVVDFASRGAAYNFIDCLYSILHRNRPKQARILILTFNAGNNPPQSAQSQAEPSHSSAGSNAEVPAAVPLLPLESVKQCSLVVVGLQECAGKRDNWLEMLERELESVHGGGFHTVHASYSWDRALFVFVRKELESAVSNVNSSEVYLGVAGIAGNKGAIGLRMTLFDTHLVFVNCHLAAHKGEVERRNSEYRALVRRLSALASSRKDDLLVFAAHYMFWLGDLNYRIDLDREECLKLINEQKWEQLAEYDQLRNEQIKERTFYRFREGALNFPPTYKMLPSGFEYTDERNRTPSWCDRVLFLHPAGTQLELHEYRPLMESGGSDHRPVLASASVELVHTTGLGVFEAASMSNNSPTRSHQPSAFSPRLGSALLTYQHARAKKEQLQLRLLSVRIVLCNAESHGTGHQRQQHQHTGSSSAIQKESSLDSSGNAVPLSGAGNGNAERDANEIQAWDDQTWWCEVWSSCFRQTTEIQLCEKSASISSPAGTSLVSWEQDELPVIDIFEKQLESVQKQYMRILVRSRDRGTEPHGRVLSWLGAPASAIDGSTAFDEPILRDGLPVGRATGRFAIESMQVARRTSLSDAALASRLASFSSPKS